MIGCGAVQNSNHAANGYSLANLKIQVANIF